MSGPLAAIEVLLATPREPLRGACVICHPHPLYGGAMSNKVVYTLASTAGKAGLATLRFNFRGVGKSTGLHDEGRGETEDTLWIAAQWRAAVSATLGQPAPLVLAGFSFGAFIVLKAAARAEAQGLMTVAPPFATTRAIYTDGDGPPPAPGCPWAVIHSRDDEVVAYEDTHAALAAYQPPPTLTTVDGAGHFFHGRLAEVTQAFDRLLVQVLTPR